MSPSQPVLALVFCLVQLFGLFLPVQISAQRPSEESAEATAPMLVFWQRIRDSGSRLIAETTVSGWPVGAPSLAPAVVAEFAASVVNSESIPADVRAARIETIEHVLPGPGHREARFVSFSANLFNEHWREVRVHVDSPAAHLKNLRLVPRIHLKSHSNPPGSWAAYSNEPAQKADLVAAKAEGAAAFLVLIPNSDSFQSQVAYPREVIGHTPREILPLPVFFLCAANRVYFESAIEQEALFTMRCDEKLDPAPRKIVGLRLKGEKRDSRLILVVGRHRRPLDLACASSAIAVASLVETARVLAVTATRSPRGRIGPDIEFLCGADGDVGFDFLNHLPADERPVLGVFSIDEMTHGRPDLTFVAAIVDGSHELDPSGRAAAGVLDDWRARPGSWSQYLVDGGGRDIEIGSPSARQRVPLVRWTAASFGGSKLRVDVPGYTQRVMSQKEFPSTHHWTGTVNDELTKVFDRQLSQPVLLVRAVLMTALRMTVVQ